MKYKNIETNEFDYYLPDNRIALYPLEKRNQSKLLVYKDGQIYEKIFFEINNEIPSDYLMVFNDTKVIPARLFFKKATGALIEIFLLEPYLPKDYSLSLNSNQKCQWTCLVGNAKKWKDQTELCTEIKVNNVSIILSAKKIESFKESFIIEFTWNNEIAFLEIIKSLGQLPIPPYLKRKTESIDYERYQTIFSKVLGSVAAPTASLHFTEAEFENLNNKNVQTTFLTLHVGAGTFKPMSSTFVHEHELHAETFIFSQSLLADIIKFFPNIISVGTTSLRSLESIYHVANFYASNNQINTYVNQWCEYECEKQNDALFAIKKLYEYMLENRISHLEVKTQLMISPGYKIKMVKGLITNFHQPKSSLLTLVAAFVGTDWKNIYDYALNNDFRFLSYGDSSLLWLNNCNKP